MFESIFIAEAEAEERAVRAARQLVESVAKFNEKHPDPDAERVAGWFDYLTDNYVAQVCASVLARSRIVLPGEKDASQGPKRPGTKRGGKLQIFRFNKGEGKFEAG